MINGFRFICVMTVLAQSGLRGFRLLLSLFALHLGASAFAVGMLLAVFALMSVVVGWPAGRWVDKAGCRAPMLWSLVLGIAGYAVAFLLPDLSGLTVAAALVGMAYGICQISQTHAVGSLSSAADRSRKLADYSLIMSVTNFIGPLLAGFSIQFAGHAGACLWFAGLALVSVALMQAGASLLPHGTGEAAPAAGGVRELLRDRSLVKILLVGGMVFAAIDVFQFYVPVYAHELGLPAATLGIIMSCFSAAAFVSRVCLKWFMQRTTVEVILRRSFLRAAAAFMVFPWVEHPVALAVLTFVYGFGLNVGQPITLMLSYDHTPKARSGEMVGIRTAVNQVTRVGAPAVFGTIGSLLGVVSVFFIGAGMLTWGALMLRKANLSPAGGKPAGEA